MNAPLKSAARRRLMAAVGLTAAALPLRSAWAQSYPNRPIKMIAGFAPGSAPDAAARFIGQKLSESLRQPVVVDNRVGAGGQIAVQVVAKAPPDGYSVVLADVGAISIAPAAFSKLPYDPIKDLVPVSEVVRTEFILVVPNKSPARTVEEFARTARSNARKVDFGTSGAGSPSHFGAEVLATQGNFSIEPIHFRNGGDIVSAVVAGDIHAAFLSTALAAPHIKAEKLRALAITGPKRYPQLPQIPTFPEAGFPKLNISAWLTLFVPAGTSGDVIATLSRSVTEVLQLADLRQQLETAGFGIVGSTQAEAQQMVAAEATRWRQIVASTGFKGD